MSGSSAGFLTVLALLAGVAVSNAGSANSGTFPSPAVDTPISSQKGEQTAVFAGGCFWGIQAVFQHVKGVISATSGYSGGAAKTAEYELVSSGETGHAESVKVVRSEEHTSELQSRFDLV